MNRIRLEVKNFSIDGVKISIHNSFYKITCEFIGPENSLFENIPIKIDFIYNREYPFKPPRIIFNPPIFHPNVKPNGILVVNSLTGNDWSPVQTLSSIIPSIQNLLYIPFICDENLRNNDKQMNDVVNDECVNLEALKLWRTNPEQYRQILLTCLE